MNKTISFLKTHYMTILKAGFAIFILYWILFILTPTMKMSQNEKAQIDSLNNNIKELYKLQVSLDSNIAVFNKEIDKVDEDISIVKNEKTIIKEIYHEKINNVSNYNDVQLDSFFTSRYGLYTH